MSDSVRACARILLEQAPAAALTGAGISVQSGIPAFRGAQGLWRKYDPMEFATIEAFLRDPAKVWTMFAEMIAVLRDARPSPAHTALAELERMGVVKAVVTQNIDMLHQAAGSSRVIEYHGNASTLVCLECGRRYPSRERIAGGIPPRCDCAAILKPDVVLFGEPIPSRAQEEAEEEVRRCGVLLVIGTSAQVSPACDLPLIAKRAGATVVEINPEKTQLTREVSDLHIGEDAGPCLRRVIELLRKTRPRPAARDKTFPTH